MKWALVRFPSILRALENGLALGQAGSAAAMACAFSFRALRFLILMFLAVYSPLQQTLAIRGGLGGARTAEVIDLELSLVGQHQELALDFDLKANRDYVCNKKISASAVGCRAPVCASVSRRWVGQVNKPARAFSWVL